MEISEWLSVQKKRIYHGGAEGITAGLYLYGSSNHAKQDFNGKTNTAKLVNEVGSALSSYAAGYCYNYTTVGTAKADWYLPAAGELYASITTNWEKVNDVLSQVGGTIIPSGWRHWSSSQYSSGQSWVLS